MLKNYIKYYIWRLHSVDIKLHDHKKFHLSIFVYLLFFSFFISDRFTIGQNLAIIWSSAPLDLSDFPGRVRKWFNEVNIYTWGQGWTVRTGHYSQVRKMLKTKIFITYYIFE